jgi:hypothetical protein
MGRFSGLYAPLRAGHTVLSKGFTVAPESASTSIVIRCTDATLSGGEATVYSMHGAVVIRYRLHATAGIDVASWAPGVYYLHLPDGSAVQILKQ